MRSYGKTKSYEQRAMRYHAMNYYGLSPEEKLLLFLSVANPSGDTLRRIGELLADKNHPVDFDWLFECAAMNEVAPVVYENLRAFDNIPRATIERFRNAYLHSVRNNVLNAEEMIRALCSPRKGRSRGNTPQGFVCIRDNFRQSRSLSGHRYRYPCQTGGSPKS